MKKKIALALCAVVALMSLSGCKKQDDDPIYGGKSREEIIEMCNNLSQQLDMAQEEYDSLFELYNGIQSESKPTSSISITGDGTNRYTFNSIDGKIVFPKEFKYPGAEFTPGNGSMSIVQGIGIEPSANWVVRLNGSKMELEHASGISGTINVAIQNYTYSASQLQEEVFPNWFKELPASNIVYTNISVGSAKLGCQAVSPTLIDGEMAYIRCGMMAGSDRCIVYTFAYKGDKDITKDEAITNLLNTLTINGQTIIIEQ